MTSSTSVALFEEMYRADADPWKFATSEYELRRYRNILAALGNRRFHHAVEPGCSVGVLTSQLGQICDAVSAFDLSPTAVKEARQRCARFSHVTISCQSFSSFDPRTVDLLVLSEIGYYFSKIELADILSRWSAELAPSATVLACHWLGDSPDHVLHGDAVHGIIGQTPGLRHELGERHEHFRINRWRTSRIAR
jgi:trans-aconitate methyltransferase